MKALLALLLAMVMAFGAGGGVPADDDNDAAMFKQEYEALNGQLAGDGVHMLPDVTLPENPPFEYEDVDDAIELLTEDTGVLYLGFPECPWCRSLVPALCDAWERTGSNEEISYFNALPLRDVRKLDDDGNIVVEKEADPKYDELVKILYDWLGEYEGLNDPSIKRIYFPTVVFVRDGEIQQVHIDTIDNQEFCVPLTEDQHERLVQLLADYMGDLLIDD